VFQNLLIHLISDPSSPIFLLSTSQTPKEIHESSRGTIWEEDGDQWEGMRDTRESIGQVNVMKVIKYMWKNVMMKPIKMYKN
jgi:hypothetical protein